MEVHSNIGLSYLFNALLIQQKLLKLNVQLIPEIHIPLVMELTSDHRIRNQNLLSSRSIAERELLIQEYKSNIKSAIFSFEKAGKLSPDRKMLDLWITVCHLLDENIPMAKGVLLGSYQRKYGVDESFNLFLSLIHIVDGKNQEAANLIEELLLEDGITNGGPLPINAYQLSLVKNYILLNERMNRSEKKMIWKTLADSARSRDDSLLFQHSIKKLNRVPDKKMSTNLIGEINRQRIFISNSLENKSVLKKELEMTFDGDKLRYISNANRFQSIHDFNGNIKSIWNISSSNQLAGTGIRINSESDRVLKDIGMPDRKIFTNRGEYFAFDKLGLSIYSVNNKVKGWFYY